MRTLMTLVLVGVFGGMTLGCDMNSSDDTTKHEVVKEHDVRDANGNVVSHSEEKQQSQSDNTMNH